MLSVSLCFSGEMSGTFAAIGLFAAWWIWSKTNNGQLASGVFFFFTMELLQAIQYLFIADSIDSPVCDNVMNKLLTIAGFLHICLQPYFCHVINCSLTRSPKYIALYSVIKKLSLIAGALMFFRYVMAPWWSTMDYKRDGIYASTEWLRGEKLCTFRGKWHLAWSVPMADATYATPGIGIHMFAMFAPFFALYEKKGMVIQGCFLFLFGPVLAGWISPNLMEQASIWCFFSIAQIAIMLFAIRETLITNWGRDSVHGSLLTGKRGAANKVQPTKDNDTFAADSDNGSNKKGKNRVE